MAPSGVPCLQYNCSSGISTGQARSRTVGVRVVCSSSQGGQQSTPMLNRPQMKPSPPAMPPPKPAQTSATPPLARPAPPPAQVPGPAPPSTGGYLSEGGYINGNVRRPPSQMGGRPDIRQQGGYLDSEPKKPSNLTLTLKKKTSGNAVTEAEPSKSDGDTLTETQNGQIVGPIATQDDGASPLPVQQLGPPGQRTELAPPPFQPPRPNLSAPPPLQRPSAQAQDPLLRPPRPVPPGNVQQQGPSRGGYINTGGYIDRPTGGSMSRPPPAQQAPPLPYPPGSPNPAGLQRAMPPQAGVSAPAPPLPVMQPSIGTTPPLAGPLRAPPGSPTLPPQPQQTVAPAAPTPTSPPLESRPEQMPPPTQPESPAIRPPTQPESPTIRPPNLPPPPMLGASSAQAPMLNRPGPPRPAPLPPPPSLGAQRPAGPSLTGPPPRPVARPPGPVPPQAPPAGAPSGLAPPPTRLGTASPLQRPAAPQVSRPMLRTPVKAPAPPPEVKGPPSLVPPLEISNITTKGGVKLVRPGSPAPKEAQLAEEKAAQARRQLIIEEVIEDDGDVYFEDEEEGPKGKDKGKKKGRGKKEKVTAEMKRKAREQREREREEKAQRERKEREEIFEVGDEGMSLMELADIIQVDPSEIVRNLFMKGIMLSMNQALDKNTVKLVASEYDLLVVDKDSQDITEGAKKSTQFLDESDIDALVPRPPVVTIMGHVDHGKTSLLDYVRKTRVAAGEAGGITQAIGAYNAEVDIDGDMKTICFLDTPGHEAFSAMRARGARVTDIAIIIVAADDGVQPQTREAISHAQAAEVPIVVAINKIDKPGADVEKTKQGLLELNLVPEEWGGNTPVVPISAKKGTGVDDLLTQVLWVAEEQQLVANPVKPAAGTVIEAHMDKKKGAVATLLVQAGTLKTGDALAAGAAYGRVRSLMNDIGKAVDSAAPSIAVQMVGLNSVPSAGEEFLVFRNEADARAATEKHAESLRNQRLLEMSGGGSVVTLSTLASVEEDTDVLQRLNIIVKGDTSGVVEAIKSALNGLPQESVMLRVLLASAGDISLSDVDLAAASGGMIVGFNLSPDEAVQTHAKKQGVTINTYKVIYNLIDDVKAAMEGKLKTIEEKVSVGTAEVKAIFGSGAKKVAGCAVLDGKLMKDQPLTVMRKKGENIVFDGKLTTLKRFKDDVKEVAAGLECGVGVEGFSDWQEGDTIECFQMVTKTRKLEEARATMAVDLSTIGL